MITGVSLFTDCGTLLFTDYIGTLIKVYALVKTELKTLVTTPQPLIQNQDFKEPTLFDNF